VALQVSLILAHSSNLYPLVEDTKETGSIQLSPLPRMDRVFSTSLQLLCIIQSLTQVAISQLTCRVTSPDNLFIVNISITNPTSNTISLLNWNNVFDFTIPLPYSFIVRDSHGNEIQQASTYAIRSGISISDLYDLEPGQGFSRQFDLRQVLQNNPSSRSRPRL